MHWNVEGMFFPVYHDLFGKIYEEVFEAIDPFAEEIRIAGGYVGYGSRHFADTNMLQESKNLVGTSVKEMVMELDMCNEIVIKSLDKAFMSAQEEHMQGLMDFLAARINAHKKHGWMLKSCIASN